MAENLKLNSPAPALDVPRINRLSLAGTLDWTIAGKLALLVVLGFGLRVTQLEAIGFAEDEMNKLDAIHEQTFWGFTLRLVCQRRDRVGVCLPSALAW